jgi:Rrf2 family protein
MRLTGETEYGLRGLLTLAELPPENILPLSVIAATQALPRSFLAKIFRKFVQHGLVRSHRGRIRGYSLARPAEEISLRDILEAVEGPGLLDRCLFGTNRCAEDRPCPLHHTWKVVRPELIELVERTTLAQVAHAESTKASEAGGRRGKGLCEGRIERDVQGFPAGPTKGASDG